MKENILYAYHIQVENILEYDLYSVFEWRGKQYYFTKLKRNEKEWQELVDVIGELEQKKVPILPFIMNIYGSYITPVGSDAYVLVEVDNGMKEYDLTDMLKRNDLVHLSNQKRSLYRNEWSNLWSEKIDYLEYQVYEMGKKYPIILNSFSYFVGLAENAVCYVNHVEKTVQKRTYPIVLSHRRITYPNYRLNYDNPLNFIFDLEVRDIAEYLKSMVLDDPSLALIDLKAYIELKRPDAYLLSMLYARLVYPSYYFDLHEKIINQNLSEEALLPIIDKVDVQEKFLKDAWYLICQYTYIEPIEWLIKKEL